MVEAIRQTLSSPLFLAIWFSSTVISLIILLWDLWHKNPQLPGLMKLVWTLTVLYSGVPGLLIYYFAGRRQIAVDSLWRKSFRSVSHCYSGCGLGEIIGVILTAGLLQLGNLVVVAVTFLLAYAIGYLLTVGPLMQDGESLGQAVYDALISETASITVMEVVAVSVDLLIAKNAQFTEVLFWSSLLLSLSIGLIAAYPINVLLIHSGVKAGMHSPKY